MAREDPHFRLRIPEELKAQIEQSAAENGRSMTAEIVHRLEKSFASAVTIEDLLTMIKDLSERVDDIERDVSKHSDALGLTYDWR